jgi:hypothetical protein
MSAATIDGAIATTDSQALWSRGLVEALASLPV